MFTKRPYTYSFWALIIIVLISGTWLFASGQTKSPLTYETISACRSIKR
ncbi:MAG TPA: hypothetical protein VN659_15595 [Pyrinomonadaceae bacterium]|nr:hypothetical protein [Pyrinomonadaceae bacterium]